MEVCVISSGSKGNCTLVKTQKHNILIDIGNSCRYVENTLQDIGLLPQDIDMILITHAHIDHVAGLRVFSKKYKPQIFITDKILKETNLELNNVRYINSDIQLDGVYIKVIKTSHDTEDSNGYIVCENGESCVYITDTGYIHEKNFKDLYDKNIYVFESNHDPEMLMNNPRYPHHTKIRILSDQGHLSNSDSAYYLSKFIGPNTKQVILAHLSEQNNSEDLAIKTLKDTLKKHNIKFDNIVCAKQNIKTELYKV